MTTLVFFGLTGDLARKKTIPSLFRLYKKGLLPRAFQIVSITRRPIGRQDVAKIIHDTYPQEDSKGFLSRFEFICGELTSIKTFQRLARHLLQSEVGTTDPVYFYLSLPPEVLLETVELLGKARLFSGDRSVIIEKPFADSSAGAALLQKKLIKFVSVDKIFRVDHYLAKSLMIEQKNMSTGLCLMHGLAFLNSVPKEINIYFNEKMSINGRGAFYDRVGALADVAQNHLYQILLVFLKTHTVSKNRGVSIIRQKDISIDKRIQMGQYLGYKQENNVSRETQIETFFAFSFRVISGPFVEQWKRVKFSFKGGKSCKEDFVGYEFVYKDKDPVRINLNLEHQHNSLDPYERVFLSAFAKDTSIFASYEEVLEGWKIVERVKKDFRLQKRSALFLYKQNSL